MTDAIVICVRKAEADPLVFTMPHLEAECSVCGEEVVYAPKPTPVRPVCMYCYDFKPGDLHLVTGDDLERYHQLRKRRGH